MRLFQRLQRELLYAQCLMTPLSQSPTETSADEVSATLSSTEPVTVYRSRVAMARIPQGLETEIGGEAVWVARKFHTELK